MAAPSPGTHISVVSPQNNLQWQIDIPSLSKLVLDIGAEGLKKIQMSGVDIHTVACLLAIGEITPASALCRKKIQKCRREQRSQRWVFNAVLEYGSGTNFIVDQLLKTRAGENILALITAVCSVLDSGSVEILSTLFAQLQIPPASTPGLGQLQNFRSACLPLARMMDFKDRVAGIHFILLRECFPQRRRFHFLDALPDSRTGVNLVMALKNLCVEDRPRHKLVYYGITGASWLIEYARGILGLDVCLIRGDGTMYPINGTYDTASVVVLPANEGPTEVLQPLLRPTDVILISERKQRNEAVNWLMSCGGDDGVDFFQLICGWDLKSRQEIGNLTYSIAKEYVEHRIYLGDMRHAKQGRPYFALHLDNIVNNLRKILHLLGLPGRITFVKDWRRTHFKYRNDDGRHVWNLELRLFSGMVEHPGVRGCCSCPPDTPMLQPEELSSLPEFCARCKLQDSVLSIAYRASCLAFTDWAEESRQMGIGAANYGTKYFQHIYFTFPRCTEQDISPAQPPLSPHTLTLNFNILGEELVTLLSGARIAFDRLEIAKQKFIGINLDGILLINYRAIELSLKPGPVFIIRNGEFSLGGEHRPIVREVPFYANMNMTFRNGNTLFVDFASEESATIQIPGNNYSRTKTTLILEASVTTNEIHLNYIVGLGPPENLRLFVTVGMIMDNLQLLKVTSPCPHFSDQPLHLRNRVLDSAGGAKTYWFKDNSDNLWFLPRTLCPLKQEEEPLEAEGVMTLVYYYPVADNSLAQWLSVANATNIKNDRFHHVYILQRECCLECTIKQAKPWATIATTYGRKRFSIIPLTVSDEGQFALAQDS